jgi:hypothetical protein
MRRNAKSEGRGGWIRKQSINYYKIVPAYSTFPKVCCPYAFLSSQMFVPVGTNVEGGLSEVGGRRCDLRGRRQTPAKVRPWRKSPSCRQCVFILESETETYLVDDGDFTVDDLTLEGFHHDGRISALELCLACRREDLSFSRRRNRHDRNDISILSEVGQQGLKRTRHTHVYRCMSPRRPRRASA